MNTENSPKFISNIPSGIDQFSSKSQEKTAQSIVEHIKNKDSEYKLVGLDGVWGSGKSNVISIIRKKLDTDKYYVFIYDAWAHQEDLQRRSFLEELTEALQKNTLTDKEKWEDKLKSLLSKRKLSTTKTVPQLSIPILIGFIIALLTPFADRIAAFPKNEFSKIIISLGPLLIAVTAWIIAGFRNREYWSLNALLYIYKERDLEKITDETVSEKEPSVREFRRWMNELSEDLKKDLIVVFDNMDRLPSDKIKILWSSIHTFFSEDPYKKIWVILPFDRNHIKSAFGEKDAEQNNHFINKTFSVIFNVAPAVLTDWQNLFFEKYHEAFQNENGHYNNVKNLFDLYNDQITPRKIISFINEVVALKLIWSDSIPIKYCALFALNKEKLLANPLEEILSEKYLDKAKFLFKNDELVGDYIAALVFNVDVEQASQVTLVRPLEVCLRDNNQEKLELLSKSKHFDSTLERIISHGQVYNIENTILVL